MNLSNLYNNLDNIIDKYKNLEILNHLIKNKELPHMIFHSNTLCHGELVRMFLKKKYKNMSKINSYNKEYKINSKTINIPIFYSNIHNEFSVNDFGYYSKNILPDLLNEIASTKTILSNQNKIVIIHNVEQLDNQAQYVLRCNFETNMKNCSIILLTNNINKLIEPLQSRCLTIRVPKLIELNKTLSNLDLDYYESHIDEMMGKLPSLTFDQINKYLYDFMKKNVSYSKIIKQIIIWIIDRDICEYKKQKLVSLACHYEHLINTTSRNFVHLQTFIMEYICLLDE